MGRRVRGYRHRCRARARVPARLDRPRPPTAEELEAANEAMSHAEPCGGHHQDDSGLLLVAVESASRLMSAPSSENAPPGPFEQNCPWSRERIPTGVVTQPLRVLAIARYVQPRLVNQHRAFSWILGRHIAHAPALLGVKVLPLVAPQGLHHAPLLDALNSSRKGISINPLL